MNFFDYIMDKKLFALIISILVNILLLISSGYLFFKNDKEKCSNIDSNLAMYEEITTEVSENFFVEIKGAVKNPGVYEANNQNIINDIIKMAGGLTKNAYTNNINLSKKVSSELVIYVYTESEYKKINSSPVIEQCICPEYEISECIQEGTSEIVTQNNNQEGTSENIDNNVITNNDVQSENKLININTASKEELMTLNGIGESKANSIIEYRNIQKFNVIDDIKNVSGIGEAAFEKIKDNITV